MGEAALKRETPSLTDLIEKISTSGQLTSSDQDMINETARFPLKPNDIEAVRHLTELVRAGAVKVV